MRRGPGSLALVLASILGACAASKQLDDAAAPPTSRSDAGDLGGDHAGHDAGPAPASPICDGSSAMRLGITSGGGFVATTYMFTNPYGRVYLFVDGHCRYYASVDYMQGFASGTLSAAEAEQLASDIGWERIASWSSYHDTMCPDAGASVITRASVAATCICGCQDMGPAGLYDAMQRALEWSSTLAARGERSIGPISAVAEPQIRPSGHELAWSLARPLTSISGLVQEANVGVTASARFDTAGDLAALRALRSGALAQDMYAQFVPVIDEGAAYLMFARDDLPDAAAAAIHALLATVSSSE